MHTIDAITALVRWLCRKLTLAELVHAAAIILEVINDRREDIKPRNDFEEKHPNYRKFSVDPLSPRLEPFPIPQPKLTLDYRQLLAAHREQTGKTIRPVVRRPEARTPPPNAHCDRCHAPAAYLYRNDGKKGNQLRCKVCGLLFPSHRCRRQSKAKYWCPYCGQALYRWKEEGHATIYKCGNDHCSSYLANLTGLNLKERLLHESGMASQFKVRYQYREYHLSPAQLRTSQPDADTIQLDRIRNHFSTVGLVLSYSVSFGLSSRMTADIIRRMHGIHISYQTVLNWQQAAA